MLMNHILNVFFTLLTLLRLLFSSISSLIKLKTFQRSRSLLLFLDIISSSLLLSVKRKCPLTVFMVEFLFEPLLHNTFVLAAFDTIVWLPTEIYEKG